MLISVVINTYNRPAALARCLEAVASQEDAEPFEVVVVDDGGEADLGAIETVWRDRLDLRPIRIEHGGASAARNRGLREARGRRVWFLGDDVVAGPGCLARHRRCDDPQTALFGPYPLADLRGSPPFRRWAEPVPHENIADPARAGFQFFCTGNLSVDRERMLELGGFDERFRYGYAWEDIDLGLRFERAGGRVVCDPEARARHEHRFDRAALWRRERAMGYNAWVYWDKWRGDAEAVDFMRFWDDPAAIHPPSAARRWLGDACVAALDCLAPDSALNRRLYERMVFTHRLQGVVEAWRAAHDAKGDTP